MSELQLSTREQIMFDMFKKTPEMSVDDLSAGLKKTGKKKLRGGSGSMTVSVRYLAYKLAPLGYYFERLSDLGRGNKARYRMHRHPRRAG